VSGGERSRSATLIAHLGHDGAAAISRADIVAW
jgi:hypothetical protein